MAAEGRKVRLQAKQSRFLTAYVGNAGNLSAAARTTGVCRDQHYYWLANCPEYMRAYKQAMWAALEDAELELTRRAINGVPKNVYYKDQLLETEHVYSDNLLMEHIRRLSRAVGDPHRYAKPGHDTIPQTQINNTQIRIMPIADLPPDEQEARLKHVAGRLKELGIFDGNDEKENGTTTDATNDRPE